MRIVHVVHQVGPEAAGVSAMVVALSEAQRSRGQDVRIFTAASSARMSTLPHLTRQAWRLVGSADVVHVHALWVSSTWIGAHVAMLRQRPYVLTPHGMLDPWALKQSAWKKRIVRPFAENRIISNAGCVHVLCESEAFAVRSLGFRNPIVLAPPGIAAEWMDALPFQERHGPPYMLFLGRIHPKKGLDLLIDAFGNVSRECPGWRLVIAGPDQVGIQPALERRALQAGIAERVTFMGPVHGPNKDRLLIGASAFALTSHSEGVPVAVIEAMACGVPVAVTHPCNLAGVEARGAGFAAPDDFLGVKDLLLRMCRTSAEERRAMGERGRAWVRERFTSVAVARELDTVYEWLSGHAPRPDTVL